MKAINKDKIFENNLETHLKNFKKKKKLIEAYSFIFELIKKNISGNINLEIGSGFGYSKKYINSIITSDYPINKYVDREINAYHISYKDNYFDNLILVDVLHHLEYPMIAFKEFNRVLKYGGRLIIVDIHCGYIPKLIFKLFHHEPIDFYSKISTSKKILNNYKYFANQSYFKRLILDNECSVRSKFFKLIYRYSWSDFRYILTGGFTKKQILPNFLLDLISFFDRNFFKKIPSFFIVRGIAVLEKK